MMFVFLFVLVGCSWGEKQVSVITETEAAATVVPMIKGVDDFVYYDGVNMLVDSAYFVPRLNINGEIEYPSKGTAFLVVDLGAFGEMANIDSWSAEKDASKILQVRDEFKNIVLWKYNVWNGEGNWASFIFVVPSDAKSFVLIFPDTERTQVNLSPFFHSLVSPAVSSSES